jgi:hypothetical protein
MFDVISHCMRLKTSHYSLTVNYQLTFFEIEHTRFNLYTTHGDRDLHVKQTDK